MSATPYTPLDAVTEHDHYIVVCEYDLEPEKGENLGGPIVMESYLGLQSTSRANAKEVAKRYARLGRCRIARLVFEEPEPSEQS